MNNVCYLITAYRDPYALPLALFDTLHEVVAYVGVSARHIYRHLDGQVPHLNGYVVHFVKL